MRSRSAVGLASTRGAQRALLFRCLLLCAAAYALALAVAAPFLWVALAHPDPLGISGQGYELDLANLLVPTRVTALRPPQLHDLAGRLGGNNLTERLGYVGPVLPAVAGFALWERRRSPLARVLALTIVAATVAALGSRLVLAGHRTRLLLPWTLVDDLPLASHALPGRAFVLVWLALAVLVALFLARGGRARWIVFGLLALTLAPNPDGSLWVTRLDRPALFQGDRWRTLVHPGENVFIVPFSFDGQAMLWQQESGFGFRMTGGYVSATFPARALGEPDRARDLRRAAAAVPRPRGARARARPARRRRAPARGLAGPVGGRPALGLRAPARGRGHARVAGARRVAALARVRAMTHRIAAAAGRRRRSRGRRRGASLRRRARARDRVERPRLGLGPLGPSTAR